VALRANGVDRFEGNRYFRTLSSGFYAELLPAWLDAFGERVRVVFTEDLQDDPVAGSTALYSWLGLEPVPAADEDVDPSESEEGGYPTAHDAGPPGRRLWPVLPRGGWRQPVVPTGAVRVPRQSDRTRQRVRALYAPANRELAALLSSRGYTSLPPWLTD
jgi:hypothetical protein